MKTATVRLFGQTKNVCENQAGVALLQVLILSALLSLVAVRFTITARDQLAMAGDLEHRLQAQMVAHSTFNQIIFSQLSQNIDVVSSDTKKTALTLPSSSILNRFGEPVKWADGVVIKMQDTNGLLPLMFPRHILWRALLKARSVPQEKVDEYLGILTDVQDAD
ncbi:MAG: hypothetical protein P8N61_12550, partial [Porticoccaceae bacterium]|nr:hypothetical protein [Porticoccaceae bacterium]